MTHVKRQVESVGQELDTVVRTVCENNLKYDDMTGKFEDVEIYSTGDVYRLVVFDGEVYKIDYFEIADLINQTQYEYPEADPHKVGGVE